MTTFRNANVIKAVTLSKLQKRQSSQIENAFAMFGKNKQILFMIMKKYIRSRRLWVFTWFPVVPSLSYQYRQSGDFGLWAVEWKCENLSFQFINDGACWNTISVYDHGGSVNMENLARLKINLVRAFPFYTVHVHINKIPI